MKPVRAARWTVGPMQDVLMCRHAPSKACPSMRIAAAFTDRHPPPASGRGVPPRPFFALAGRKTTKLADESDLAIHFDDFCVIEV